MINKAIIFDIDGVLLDLQKAESRAYVQAFEVCFGLTGISDDWDSYPAHTDIALAKDILSERWGRPCRDWEWQKIINSYDSILKTEIYGRGKQPILVPGVKPLLEYLAGRQDVALALATGNAYSVACSRLGQAGIWSYFQCGGFAENGDKKSQILTRAIFECRTRWPGLQKCDILYLGDHDGDIQAAEVNGVNFILVSPVPRVAANLNFKTYANYLDLKRFVFDLSAFWEME